VDGTGLVAHDVGIDVLLGPLLGPSWLLERLLEHIRVGEHFASETEVHARAHFLDFNARQFLAGSLGAEQIEAQLDFGVGKRVRGLDGGHGDEILQAFDVDLGGVLALEEINQERLGQRVFGLGRVFENGAVEADEGLKAD